MDLIEIQAYPLVMPKKQEKPTSGVMMTADATRAVGSSALATVFHGDSLQLVKAIPDGMLDLTISSPPYCMGKEYEKRSSSVDDFIDAHRSILPEIVRATAEGGSICWQVGYHLSGRVMFPLDYAVYEVMRHIPDVSLRNRIVWTFQHGLHDRTRFSGRHEVVLWFTKGMSNRFDLDAVRVRQKYPGKRSYKGPNKGQFSGNPLGKNPGDVWEIPNVKGNHIEKTAHPCQFPVALAQRLVRALTMENGVVFDPFMGAGSAGVAALLERRRFLGGELQRQYVDIAQERLRAAVDGSIRVRPIDMPIHVPSARSAVATAPDHFFPNFERNRIDEREEGHEEDCGKEGRR